MAARCPPGQAFHRLNGSRHTTAYALIPEDRGTLFYGPGVAVYEGMVGWRKRAPGISD